MKLQERPCESALARWSGARANRGHSLTIDSGWREVADAALTFIRRFVNP